jgi:hypothetical protein
MREGERGKEREREGEREHIQIHVIIRVKDLIFFMIGTHNVGKDFFFTININVMLVMLTSYVNL